MKMWVLSALLETWVAFLWPLVVYFGWVYAGGVGFGASVFSILALTLYLEFTR